MSTTHTLRPTAPSWSAAANPDRRASSTTAPKRASSAVSARSSSAVATANPARRSWSDSSAATDGQTLVLMLNDDVHEIAPELPADRVAEYEAAAHAYASLMTDLT